MKQKITTTLMSIAIGGLLLIACKPTSNKEQLQKNNLTQFVDQRIGTEGHGHVFMGANVPYGFVQLGPTSIPVAWDWCSGYNVRDTTCIGFSHTHLSGTGIGDLADVTLMPVVGDDVTPGRGTEKEPYSGQASMFTHATESFAPGYYHVFLDRYKVDVSLTATNRTGLHHYIYPKDATSTGVILDLENGTCWDKATTTGIVPVDAKTFKGYRNSKGWADNQQLSFAIKFNKSVIKTTFYDEKGKVISNKTKQREARFARFDFDLKDNKELLVKVGLSPVDGNHALTSIKEELPDWSFDKIKKAAKDSWNKELARIEVASKDTATLQVFYTAMYHSMIAPSVFMDSDGSYRGADGKIYNDTTFVNYTTFSLWDTYRALHPMMTIVHPERVNDLVNTMLHIYEQQGKLPVWHLMGCETNCMVGNPAINVVADAMLKGFKGFDYDLAYKAMTTSSMLDERELDLLKKYGYIPSDLGGESIGNDMEYAIADASVAKIAKMMDDKESEDYFTKRSHSYRYYFDPETHFARGRFADGSWRTPFDPLTANHRDCDYVEGNAYQYTWLVPHDLEGLVNLFGSRRATLDNLDTLFTTSAKLKEGSSSDMTGLIGQYVHGNEPSHHILYFYTLLNEPWKGADKIRQVFSTLYSNKADGLAGNEDVGQMSAWYILSSMGLYQVDPAGGDYIFGSPILDKAAINLPDNKQFVITAENNSATNKYIQSITLNGQDYTKAGISYKDIMNGGELVFNMGDKAISWMK